MNPSTAQAEVLVDELVRCGVTDAVLCPGSRNAPLSFALHRADAAGLIRLHVRIDERTGGFLALGLALRSGHAVPVVCTSGTAAANLHPAMLEACYAGVPLLAFTADRPPELVGTGANQTIEQSGLFAGAPRLSITLAVASSYPGQVVSWRAAIAKAVATALGRLGGRIGPVHVNLPFAEPLVPEPGQRWVDPLPGRPGGEPWTALAPAPTRGWTAGGAQPADSARVGDEARGVDEAHAADSAWVVDSARVVDSAWASDGHRAADHVTLALDPAAPTLVLAGAVPAGPIPGLPPVGDAPVVAEPSSPLWPRAVRTGPWLLDTPAADLLRPAQVLLYGRPTLHRSVARLLADPAVAVYAVAGTVGATGPSGGELAPSVRAVGTPPPLRPPADWCTRWSSADRAASEVLDKALADSATPIGPRLAAALVGALPDGSLLLLGSSNPVRDVALAARPRVGLTVLANRGVAGIDGSVSTATGAALAHGAPSYALLGDLTTLHDLTGLLLGPEEPRPDLTLVVLNDFGGGIFSLLEQGAPEHAAGFERVFGTPHTARLDALCAGFGIAHRRVDDLTELPDALAPGTGVRVVEVPASRSDLRTGHATLRTTISTAVSAAMR